MKSRQLVLGLLVSFLAFSCTKKGNAAGEGVVAEAAATETEDSNKDQADTSVIEEPGTPNDFLVGKWASECINQPESLQASVILQYEFLADGSATSKTVSYAQANCVKRFTKADVDIIKDQINADRALLNQAPLNPTEAAPYENLWFPIISAFKFKLGKTLTEGPIEMNTTQKVGEQDSNSYLMIYLRDGYLYFAETCSKSELDSQICKRIVGDSVKNRASDMTKATPFHKI